MKYIAPIVKDGLDPHFVSPTCGGEKCKCGQSATHKVGEEKSHYDPTFNYRHNFTQYVCCQCFTDLFGNATFCGLAAQNTHHDGWVSVETEADLPRANGDYLVTMKTPSSKEFVTTKRFFSFWHDIIDDEDRLRVLRQKEWLPIVGNPTEGNWVIAWKKKPEPYKG